MHVESDEPVVINHMPVNQRNASLQLSEVMVFWG